MSVIENALKKLQSSPPKSATRPRPTSPLRSGSAIAQAENSSQPVAASRQRVVEIDRQTLRAAGLIPPLSEERQLAQQYRRIKRPLIAGAMGIGREPLNRGNLIMVTSAIPGEGKTFSAINLALSMAVEEDLSVLLVDGDVARPRVSQIFGIESEGGLLDVLRDPARDLDSVTLTTSVPRLSLVPAGAHADNATELLASARMQAVLRALAEREPSRIVLFDSPPMLFTTEAQALVGSLSQIVVVVQAGKTSQDAVRAALNMIGEGKPVGLVLNQSTNAPDAGYTYYNEPRDASST